MVGGLSISTPLQAHTYTPTQWSSLYPRQNGCLWLHESSSRCSVLHVTYFFLVPTWWIIAVSVLPVDVCIRNVMRSPNKWQLGNPELSTRKSVNTNSFRLPHTAWRLSKRLMIWLCPKFHAVCGPQSLICQAARLLQNYIAFILLVVCLALCAHEFLWTAVTRQTSVRHP